MDAEKSEVLDMPEAPNQEEVAVVENQEEKVEPEKPAAAVEAPEPVNDQAEEAAGQVVEENQENVEVLVDESAKKSENVEVVTPSDPDESSEKVPDPVVAAEQQSVPENSPEPPAVQPQLAEVAPEPEKSAEPAPVTAVQEQAALSKTEEPSTKEESKEEPSPAAAAVVEVSPEKPEKNESAESGNGDSAQSEQEVHAQSASVTAAEPVQPEAVHPEPKEAPKEDVAPAPGSLSFALLNQEQTKDALKTSRTLVVLRGLPGSGKSFLARAIADSYKDLCSVICADAHGVKPEQPEGYKALDDAVVACCKEGGTSSALIVVDDTNHTHERLARFGEIAEEHNLVLIVLEPQTEWRRDVAQLEKKTQRQLDEAKLQAMKVPLEEVALPLYFGWFLLPAVQEKIRCTSMDFLKTLDTLEAFKKHLIDFTGKPDQEVDLEQYYKSKGTLHCTTQFCNYGKVEGSKEYAQNPAVQSSYGSVFELSLTALFVTPRTVGARVNLTEEQLLLWPADAEKEAESVVPAAASLPKGSRAHVTLGCSEGVEPVQTGFDLLQILALQKDGQQGEPLEMELGSLIYYSEGRWILTLREPISVPACFSSFYAQKEQEPPKKEPEKKKQKKCSIL